MSESHRQMQLGRFAEEVLEEVVPLAREDVLRRLERAFSPAERENLCAELRALGTVVGLLRRLVGDGEIAKAKHSD